MNATHSNKGSHLIVEARQILSLSRLLLLVSFPLASVAALRMIVRNQVGVHTSKARATYTRLKQLWCRLDTSLKLLGRVYYVSVHFCCTVAKYKVWALNMFVAWRHSVNDFWVLFVGLNTLTVWPMWRLWSQYWVSVQRKLYQSGSSLTYFASCGIKCCARQALAHHIGIRFPFRLRSRTWRSKDDTAAWDEKMYSKPSYSRCLTSPWLKVLKSPQIVGCWY